jgi:predicted dehydrogenase
MKKYVIAGCSGRAIGMFAQPIQKTFSKDAELVGLFDPNHKRIEYYNSQLDSRVNGYTDFNKMMKTEKPDCVIVATIDSHHHTYIIAALEAGCDAITEKPMTIDEKKCAAILKAEKKSGKKVYVTFNYRHNPYCTRIKQMLREGKVGDILSIHFEWYLDTRHGADYFRRWHRRKENSGGLLVHKATHHFDIANWFLEEDPVSVHAFGDRRFYGPTRKERGTRCLTCKHKKTCEFYWDIEGAGERIKGLYIDAESVDKYYRDGCVFSPEIDIEDTMSVNIKYSNGAFMTYSLVAHSPYEAWRMSINGSAGRLEIGEDHSGNNTAKKFHYIDYFDRKGGKITYEIPKATGGHGGGDERLLRMLFVGDLEDPLGLMAGTKAGAMSILTGISANKSIKSGKIVDVTRLVPEEFRKKYYKELK